MKFIKISTPRSFVYLNAAICKSCLCHWLHSPLPLCSADTLPGFSCRQFRSSCRLLFEGVCLQLSLSLSPSLPDTATRAVSFSFVYLDLINHTPRVQLDDKRPQTMSMTGQLLEGTKRLISHVIATNWKILSISVTTSAGIVKMSVASSFLVQISKRTQPLLFLAIALWGGRWPITDLISI